MSAFRTWLVSSSAVLVALILYAGPASAEVVSLNCPGIMAVKYSPGMSNTPRYINSVGTGTFGPCVGMPLDLLFVSYDGVGAGTTSCLTSSMTVQMTLTWSDGSVSQLNLSQTLNTRPTGQVVALYQGSVGSGRFTGASATYTQVLAQTDLLGCFTEEGVTATAGPGVFVITRLL